MLIFNELGQQALKTEVCRLPVYALAFSTQAGCLSYLAGGTPALPVALDRIGHTAYHSRFGYYKGDPTGS